MRALDTPSLADGHTEASIPQGGYASLRAEADRYTVLSLEEEATLLATYHNPDSPEEARDRAALQLIGANIPLILKWLRDKGFGPERAIDDTQRARLDDMASAGKLGLWEAVRRYDANRAVEGHTGGKHVHFVTVARTWVNKYLMEAAYLLSLRDTMSRDDFTHNGRIRRAISAIQAREGSDTHPTNEAIAEELAAMATERGTKAWALSAERVADIRQRASVAGGVRLDAPMGDDSTRTVGETLADTAAPETEAEEERVALRRVLAEHLHLHAPDADRRHRRQARGLPVITGVGHRAGLDAVTVRPAAGLTADEITEQLGASRAALRHGLQVMTEALIGRGARERLLVDGAGSTDTSPTIAWLLTELGIITAGDATPAMGCPDGASDPAGTPMQVEGERWSCACCGATGDVFDLYVRVAGLAPERAVSLRESWPTLRRARPAPEGAIVVDPQRIQQLQQHRAATW